MRTLATQLLASLALLLLSAASWADADSCPSLCSSTSYSCTQWAFKTPRDCSDYSASSYNDATYETQCCVDDSGAIAGLAVGVAAAFILLLAVLPRCCGLPCCFGLFSRCRKKCACCDCECLGDDCNCRCCNCDPGDQCCPCTCCCAVGEECAQCHDNCCCMTDADAAALDAKTAAGGGTAVVVATAQPDSHKQQEPVVAASNSNQQQQSTSLQQQPQPQPLYPPQPLSQKNAAAATGRFSRDDFVTHEYQGALRVAANFKPTKSCKDYLLEDCAPILTKVKQLPFIVDDCCEIADARLAKAAVAPHLFPQLSPDEALALAVYTYDLGVALENDGSEENFFEGFSHLLLDRNPGTMRQLAGYLYYFVHALQKMPAVDQGKLAYRGVDGRAYDAIVAQYRHGASCHWSQFTSTSTDPTVAKQFAAQKTADGKPGILFVISVVAGHSVASHSAFANEQEVILDANAALVVTQPPTPDPETGIVVCKLQQTSGAKIIR